MNDPLAPGADLLDGPLEIVGRLLESSNTALLVRVGGDPARHAIYKPIAGERALWDFPDGHLAHREVATFLASRLGGWGLVPDTVLRPGPFGPGSVQRWVTPPPGEEDADASDDTPDLLVEVEEEDVDEHVRLLPPDAVPPGWLPVLTGELADGSPVVVAHADSDVLRSVAVFDAVVNNSDRKATHLLPAPGRLWCIDHGVTLHEDDKLRTVLWGWAGEPLPDAELERLATFREALADPAQIRRFEELLTVAEVDALTRRLDGLLRTRRHPHPAPGWPAIPWPPI